MTPSPSPLYYVLGFGLLLVVAVPGIGRALRHFERDGDRFMLVWLIVNILGLYAPPPFNLQRRLAIGLIIPIVYFAVRALEDFWFHRISPRWRYPAMIALFVFVLPSNILSLGIPVVGVLRPESGYELAQVMPVGYVRAFHWLDENTVRDQVVLAPPRPSLWIPAYTDLRVVYGHRFETLYATKKLEEVTAWYKGEGCAELLSKYQVKFVLSDTLPGTETKDDRCIKMLGEPVAVFDGVSVHEVR